MERGTDEPSPARLYAALAGALLTIGGIVGFFYGTSFGSPGTVDEALGAFDVNGWLNLLHLLTGVIGLLVAGYAARQYALWTGLLYVAIGCWGLIGGDGASILGFIPLNGADDTLHLALGALGACAAFSTPQPVAGKARPAGERPARAT